MTPTPDSPAPKSPHNMCMEDAKKTGLPYPRTCPICKLGPCQKYPRQLPAQAPTVGDEAREARLRALCREASSNPHDHGMIVDKPVEEVPGMACWRHRTNDEWVNLRDQLEAEIARLNTVAVSQAHTIQAQAEEIVGLRKDREATGDTWRSLFDAARAALAAQDGKGEG